MTRVDFYILPDVDEIARHRFTSRLAARAVAAGNRVYVRAEASAVEPLDALMWDYPPAQFLPHAPLATADGEPVTIGRDADEPGGGGMMINLAADIPAYLARFERVAEVVLAPQRATGRAKYRQYRERGYRLFHHELDDWE
jgi:DNA polymerase-3 subunit chi